MGEWDEEGVKRAGEKGKGERFLILHTFLKKTLKVARNSFPFSITTELYERFTRL